MDARHLSPAALNERRRQAVELRLAGKSVAETAATVSLSRPTVMAAHAAFLKGGWEAVAVGRRGRSAGAGRKLSAELEGRLLSAMRRGPPDAQGLPYPLWSDAAVGAWLKASADTAPPVRSLKRYRTGWGIDVAATGAMASGRAGSEVIVWRRTQLAPLQRLAGTAADAVWTGTLAGTRAGDVVYARTSRGRLYWLVRRSGAPADDFIELWSRLLGKLPATPVFVADGFLLERTPVLRDWLAARRPPVRWLQAPLPATTTTSATTSATTSIPMPSSSTGNPGATLPAASAAGLTHLQRLEAESIHILREVVAEAEKPVMLYSIGKDSAVMLHLAMKAFYPAVPPFPLLHVDTTWKFQAMYEFRNRMAKETGMDLIVHVNPDGLAKGINPFTHGSAIHTDVMKTEGLKQALEQHGFDVAFGGARRDEEKSRAKERIFSFRTAQHRWDPKNQRPELWSLYNARKQRGESIRVFPLSNWTELDIWQYIYLQNIPIVPLYFAAPRPVVERDGTLIMVDDDRMPLRPGEVPLLKKVRFRTLGCYPLTGAIESEADTLTAIIQEMLLARTSERQGRVIDHDGAGSMERKKQEGYF